MTKRCSDNPCCPASRCSAVTRAIARDRRVEHLAQVMRNIDDCDAFRAQLAHDVEQALTLATRQSGMSIEGHRGRADGRRGQFRLSCISATTAGLRACPIERSMLRRSSAARASRAHHRSRHERARSRAGVRDDDILPSSSGRGELLIHDDDRGATCRAGEKRARLSRQDRAFVRLKIASEICA